MKSLSFRISALIQRRGPTDCWTWQGRTNPDGAPVIEDMGLLVLVQREVLQEQIGTELPPKEDPRPTCGSRLCCNPRHIARAPALVATATSRDVAGGAA